MNVSFERVKTGKDEWLTPLSLIQAIGEFDLDPCSPINRPWPTAKKHFTIEDDGLIKQWEGKVFCNPPYGNETATWLNKCASYGNAIALTFARTETKMFFESVWPKATAVLFIKGRIRFFHVSGEQGDSAGAPSILIAYGEECSKMLETSKVNGKFIRLKQ